MRWPGRGGLIPATIISGSLPSVIRLWTPATHSRRGGEALFSDTFDGLGFAICSRRYAETKFFTLRRGERERLLSFFSLFDAFGDLL